MLIHIRALQLCDPNAQARLYSRLCQNTYAHNKSLCIARPCHPMYCRLDTIFRPSAPRSRHDHFLQSCLLRYLLYSEASHKPCDMPRRFLCLWQELLQLSSNYRYNHNLRDPESSHAAIALFQNRLCMIAYILLRHSRQSVQQMDIGDLVYLIYIHQNQYLQTGL